LRLLVALFRIGQEQGEYKVLKEVCFR